MRDHNARQKLYEQRKEVVLAALISVGQIELVTNNVEGNVAFGELTVVFYDKCKQVFLETGLIYGDKYDESKTHYLRQDVRSNWNKLLELAKQIKVIRLTGGITVRGKEVIDA